MVTSLMSIATDDYITSISLGISLISILLVILLVTVWRKQPSPESKSVEPLDGDNSIEVSAIVSEFTLRLKRLEENLVDQKVKLEILELRVNRQIASQASPATSTFSEHAASDDITVQRPSTEFRPPAQPRPIKAFEQRASTAPPVIAPVDQRPGSTEMEALRFVFEGRGRVTAREIQQKIGRTREHTARMMNSLYHEGLVERDVTARPFAYSITQKGRDVLNH